MRPAPGIGLAAQMQWLAGECQAVHAAECVQSESTDGTPVDGSVRRERRWWRRAPKEAGGDVSGWWERPAGRNGAAWAEDG